MKGELTVQITGHRKEEAAPTNGVVAIWFYDARDQAIFIFFLTKPTGNVIIETIIADHLLPLIRDRGASRPGRDQSV